MSYLPDQIIEFHNLLKELRNYPDNLRRKSFNLYKDLYYQYKDEIKLDILENDKSRKQSYSEVEDWINIRINEIFNDYEFNKRSSDQVNKSDKKINKAQSDNKNESKPDDKTEEHSDKKNESQQDDNNESQPDDKIETQPENYNESNTNNNNILTSSKINERFNNILNIIGKFPSFDLFVLNHTKKKSQKKWASIAREIFLRKSLIFAAKKDLENNHIDDALQKATTDVFVEKAQKILTMKGRWLFLFATISISITIIGLSLFVIVLLDNDNINKVPKDFSTYDLVLHIMLNITIASAVLGGAYILFSLAKAFLHEGQVAFNKRHALRFGRLYVYLKKGAVDFKDLEEAFKWNTEFNSAFKDINAEIITKTIYKSLIDTIPKVTEVISTNVRGMKETKEK